MFIGAFDSIWIIIVGFFLLIGIVFYVIPGKKTEEFSIYIVKNEKYKCPKGFKIDENLTCFKTYKAIKIN